MIASIRNEAHVPERNRGAIIQQTLTLDESGCAHSLLSLSLSFLLISHCSAFLMEAMYYYKEVNVLCAVAYKLNRWLPSSS